jgi:hypothetical protein
MSPSENTKDDQVCPQGGNHDWISTRGARVLSPWLKHDTVRACMKCGVIDMVEDGLG